LITLFENYPKTGAAMCKFCVNCSLELDPEKQSFHPNFSDWCSSCFSEFLEMILGRINLDDPREIECLTCDNLIQSPRQVGFWADCVCGDCQEIFLAAYNRAVKTIIKEWSDRLDNRLRRGD
jgi:hypothetical protein